MEDSSKAQVQHSHQNIISLLVVVFLGLFGMGIVYPILPLVFLEGNFFPTLSSQGIEIMLGLLLASYPFAQFIGAPVLGKLSDKFGRKPILAISLFGSSIGYGLFAVGLLVGNAWLLFISRLLDGFTGGSVSVAFSSIADMSTSENKTKNFGLLGMAFGLGLIMGPFAGGVLSDNTIHHFFGPALPFWAATVLVTITVLLILLFYKETIRDKIHRKINPFAGFLDIWRTLKIKELRVVFITVFFMNIGWSFFSVFYPVYLAQKIGLGNGAVGAMLGYIGIWVAISQGLILRPVASRFSDRTILLFGLFISPIFLFISLIPTDSMLLYFILPFMAVPFAFTQPTISSLVSNAVGEHSQGEIMGIRQSYVSLAQVFPPIIAGISLQFGVFMPMVLAGVSIFIALGIFSIFYEEHEKTVEL